ncbi:MAG: tetratricopeptide repeat protein [Candidatus Omnitrophica bacterium]|nr:tetratricopeptide repeat protein [Candidatus Omnitrophota bacterium]
MTRPFLKWLAVGGTWVLLLGIVELGAWAVLRRAPPDSFTQLVLAERLQEPKPPGEIRVFLFGGSTMNGAYFRQYASPQIWIRTLLLDLCPADAQAPAAAGLQPGQAGRWRIVNFSRDGRGTDEIVARMRRALRYEPDVFFVYAAHNEGLTINTKKHQQAYRVKEWMRRSHFVRLAEDWIEQGRDRLRVVRKAMDSRLTGRRLGLVKRPTDEDLVLPGSEKKQWIEANARRNLRTMYELTRQAGVACLLSTFVSNEAEFPPSRSVHRAGMDAEALRAWEAAYEAARAHVGAGRWADAIPLLESARALDPQYASAAFDLGTCLRRLGRTEAAQRAFAEAIELDALPNRDSPRLNDDLRQIAQEFGLPLVEFREAFLRTSSDGLIGRQHVVDNCHLDAYGYYLLARTFLETLAPLKPFTQRCAWRWDRLKPFEAYERALPITDAQRAEVYKRIGIYLGSRFDWAVENYQRALAYAPDDPETQQLLVLAYYQSGRQRELAEAMADMARRHPAEFARMLQDYPELAATTAPRPQR